MGLWKLILILGIVLVVFGPGKLPDAMKDLAKGFKSLKDELGKDETEEKVAKAITVSPDKKDS